MTTIEPAGNQAHCLVCGDVVPEERSKHHSTTCTEEHARERKAAIRRGDHSAKCVVCTEPIPVDRQRYRSITCTPEHGVLRKASIRAKVDQRQCRSCRKPSTPLERGAFQRFRRLELTQPDILYPKPFKQWQQENPGGDPQGFAEALRGIFQEGIESGDDTSRADYLGLLTARSKEVPGGVRSGRKPIQWTGGDPDCEHQVSRSRAGRKPIEKAMENKCRKCDAVRVKPEAEATNAKT